ncbi:CBS domain-containing protein [Sulfuriflexus sp.]|uniref:CBS domain-containing protein n=1 Tax=Sulfuriflexus sp. TaxID=2015443 RepID=UPI0028CDA8E7|nr:CBS domain-containing protein [Sulfuriflexus sp.]MDT8403745.1 CBS domain-containing protein [Sulfuriflexus sp.]
MSVGEFCNREVIVVKQDESVREAVKLMRTHHIGDVVIVAREGDASRPLGILTDRDVVLEILAEDVDIDSVNVGDVMSYELATVDESASLMDAVKLMQSKGVRRLPVVNGQGYLVGILTVDDLVEIVSEELGAVAGLISKELRIEEKRRRAES